MRKLIIHDKEIQSVRIICGNTEPEKYAASELEAYFCKFGIPISEDGTVIHISLDENLKRDSWAITCCACGGLCINGGNGRGVIYGVYNFLEKYAGVRYFTPELETLGEGDIVVNEDYAFSPVFEYRRLDWKCGYDLTWRLKMGINDDIVPIPAEKGGYIKQGVGHHSMEYFLGIPQYKQPCLSDPENLKTVIAKVRQVLKEKPDSNIICVSQNDCQRYCTCEKCAAVDVEEGSHAGTMIRFVNAVAADIAEDYPNVHIQTFAYQYTRKAPKITKPLPNVSVQLCSIECCFCHPLNDLSCSHNRDFVQDIEDWSKICDRLYIWDYVTNFAYYLAPFPNFAVLRENMRFFAEHGAKGMYPEGNFNSPMSGEFGELRCYLLAKLMMNPYMSTTEYYQHMDEFLAAYYGAGWRYLRAFIDYTCMEASSNHMKIYDAPFLIIGQDRYEAIADNIDNWWNKAEELAEERLEAVQRSWLQWRYVQHWLHRASSLPERSTDMGFTGVKTASL